MTYQPGRDASRGRLFDSVADTYWRGRPEYPDEIFTKLVAVCGLGEGVDVLEIGAGAGHATLPMLKLGANVLAIEPGERFAELLAERVGGFPCNIQVGTFEDSDIEGRKFDLVVAATSFHWVNPETGLPKVAAALKQGGWFGLWWSVYADPSRPDPFHIAIDVVLERHAPELIAELRVPSQYALDRNSRAEELSASGFFDEVSSHVVSWTKRHTPSEIRALFSTFSPWLALPPDRQRIVLDAIEQVAAEQFAGVVDRPYQTVMYLARRA